MIVSDTMYDQISSYNIKFKTILEYMTLCATICDGMYAHITYYI